MKIRMEYFFFHCQICQLFCFIQSITHGICLQKPRTQRSPVCCALLNFPVNSLGQENDVIVYPNCNTKNGVAHLAM